MTRKYLRAFSLIEILIYTGIIAVVGALFGGVLLNVTKIQNRQSASGELNTQLQFVLDNINRLIKDSSNIDINNGVSTSTLVLRMKDEAQDPTLVYTQNNKAYLKQGTASPAPLNSDSVLVNSLTFYKISSYPGHDSVQIDLTMSSNTQNPQQQSSLSLSSAVARVSAATFDGDLIPGATNNYNLGIDATRWKNLYLSGDLSVSGKTTLGSLVNDPTGANGMIYYNTASNAFRGYQNGVWTNLGGGPWATNVNDIYNTNTGNTGVGINSPASRLEIRGADNTQLRIGKTGAPSQYLSMWFGSSDGVIDTVGATNGLNFFMNGTQRMFLSNAGNLTINGLTIATGAGSGKVLTSDGSGNATWQTPSSGGCATGNFLNGWTNANDLPSSRLSHSSITLNNYLYVIGGTDSGGTNSGVVYYAKINSNGSQGPWNTTTSLPQARRWHTTFTANGYIYAIGGYNSGAKTTVYYAQPNADGSISGWNTTSSLSSAAYLHSTIYLNGYVYAIGGYNSSDVPHSVVQYAAVNANGTLGTWNTTTSLPSPREQHTSVVANGYVYVVAGHNNAGGQKSDVYYALLNADGTVGTWNTTVSLPVALYNHTSVFTNNYMYIIGGTTGPTTQSKIYYANTNTDGTIGPWMTSATDLPAARLLLSATLGNGFIYVTGGGTNGGNPSANTYFLQTQINCL